MSVFWQVDKQKGPHLSQVVKFCPIKAIRFRAPIDRRTLNLSHSLRLGWARAQKLGCLRRQRWAKDNGCTGFQTKTLWWLAAATSPQCLFVAPISLSGRVLNPIRNKSKHMKSRCKLSMWKQSREIIVSQLTTVLWTLLVQVIPWTRLAHKPWTHLRG
jgi:hypothetical protein